MGFTKVVYLTYRTIHRSGGKNRKKRTKIIPKYYSVVRRVPTHEVM